jgi:hypothetical protein
VKAKRPKLPEELTFEKARAYKSALRCYDRSRIESGKATPDQVQRENEAVPPSRKAVIISFPELEPVK